MKSSKRRPCFSPSTLSPESLADIEGIIGLYEKKMKGCQAKREVITWHLIILRNFMENFLPEIKRHIAPVDKKSA